MTLEITDIFGNRLELQPRVELYSVRDFMGQEIPAWPLLWMRSWTSPMAWNPTPRRDR